LHSDSGEHEKEIDVQHSDPIHAPTLRADADLGGHPQEGGKFYLIGGGIASLAAAAFLIRDGHVRGCDITILEALDKPGGSLDGAGTAQGGCVPMTCSRRSRR
jgi:oleate hydratase